jgi:hypothetical protein
MEKAKVKIRFSGTLEDIVMLREREEFDSDEAFEEDGNAIIEKILTDNITITDKCYIDEIIGDISFINPDTGEEYEESGCYEIG